MSILETELAKYKPNYHKKVRLCDGPGCMQGGYLNPYFVSRGLKLLFCNEHFVNPYNYTGLKNNDLMELPMFNDNYYKIIDDNNNIICNRRGCQSIDIIRVHSDYFCTEHAKEITSITVKYIDKKDPMTLLFNKLKEFNYRKTLHIKNIESIFKLETDLSLDRTLYSKSVINIIHYQYAYDNYYKKQSFKGKIMLQSSSEISTSGDNTPNSSPVYFHNGNNSGSEPNTPVLNRKESPKVITNTVISPPNNIQHPKPIKAPIQHPKPIVTTEVVTQKISDIKQLDTLNSYSLYSRDPADFLRNPTFTFMNLANKF